MAAEDMTAVHLANACQQVGAMVPQQVAILGVDDDRRACRMTTPPLSSIDHGAREAGFRAAELLAGLMEGQPPPEHPIYVQPRCVVTRQSTNTLAIDHPDVARATRFIHENFHEGITPRDVVASVPVARRSLETAFRRHLGRTILQEIQRVRIDRVKYLLSQTDLAMPEICELTGSSSPSRLSQAFKNAVGLPPSHYRRESRL
jgi:LacI family transcriptional regulator